MLFSSMIFLWVFLPITLILHTLIDKKYKNKFLLLASLIFYAWGEPKYILLMILSICINYVYGIFIDKEDFNNKRKVLLWQCIILNLGLLAYFKYFNFIIDNINNILSLNISAKFIALPIGISFYTFQSLSYVVDVYRGKNGKGNVKAQKNIFDLALYVALFPQLIAGPIVKYHDIERQIENRTSDICDISYGVKRFIYGLSKKVIISNTMAMVADEIFALPISYIGTSLAWLGIICYTLQIYFDFSGYSDMAIGIGKMIGFTFMENFNYPYISRSIQEFWTRWHISLSTWFKEYLYIPLGGNRKGKYKTYRNLIVVFFATGLWHGASWNFIVWGLFNGFFIVMERMFLGKLLDKNKFKIINHIYTVIIFVIGWTFFRAENLTYGLEYVGKLFVYSKNNPTNNLWMFLNTEVIVVIILGALLSGPLQYIFPKFKYILHKKDSITWIEIIYLILLLSIVIIYLASGVYNPFIYFRF